MKPKQFGRSAARWLACGLGLGVVSYATYVTRSWFHYGKPKPAAGDDVDVLLDQFMPRYDVGDRHKIGVAAPAEVTLSAAMQMDMETCSFVRGIFKAREWILGSEPENMTRPRGLIAQTKSLGWGVLAERSGREIVMGCATKPWEANPIFRTLHPDEFREFDEPGYVKIVWTLRADPAGNSGSVFRTETRAVATDRTARKKFRRYWSFLSPGIILIRYAMLPALKADAERRRGNIAAERGAYNAVTYSLCRLVDPCGRRECARCVSEVCPGTLDWRLSSATGKCLHRLRLDSGRRLPIHRLAQSKDRTAA